MRSWWRVGLSREQQAVLEIEAVALLKTAGIAAKANLLRKARLFRRRDHLAALGLSRLAGCLSEMSDGHDLGRVGSIGTGLGSTEELDANLIPADPSEATLAPDLPIGGQVKR